MEFETFDDFVNHLKFLGVRIVEMQKDYKEAEGDIKIAYKNILNAKYWNLMRTVDVFKRHIIKGADNPDDILIKMTNMSMLDNK
jgi:hypothetical protein